MEQLPEKKFQIKRSLIYTVLFVVYLTIMLATILFATLISAYKSSKSNQVSFNSPDNFELSNEEPADRVLTSEGKNQ